MEHLTKQVKELVKKAGEALSSNDALKFSQAALNAANAINVVKNLNSAD